MRTPCRPARIVATLFTLLGLSTPLGATDWSVDASNPNCPGSGTSSDPFCTITDAVAVAVDGDSILIAAGTYFEHLVIDADISLVGTSGAAATVIDGQRLDRILLVMEDARVDLDGLTLANGQAPGPGGGILVSQRALVQMDHCVVRGNRATPDGVADGNGGGIHVNPDATVVARDCEIVDNTAMLDGSGGASGGGIHLERGSASLVRSTIRGNRVTALNADILIEAAGGGIFGRGSVRIDLIDSSLSENVASANGRGRRDGALAYGGGLYILSDNREAVVSLVRSTIANNSAEVKRGGSYCAGGGIYLVGATLTVEGSSVYGNSVLWDRPRLDSYGGGVYLHGTDATIVNTTISGNFIEGQGGGLYVNREGSAPVFLDACTIASNSADEGGGIYQDEGRIEVANTIIADSAALDGTNDCSGTLISKGYNLIENTTGCTLQGDLTGVITGVDPSLGPLQDNGGPTLTHALLSASVGIEAANPDPSLVPPTDQRGRTRPADGDCDGIAIADLGAFEAFGAAWSNYGDGWPGTHGIPALTASAPPIVGSQITVDLENSLGASTVALLFVGLAEDDEATNLGGTLLVDPLLRLLLLLPASGVSLPFDINDPALCGVEVFVQALEDDIGASKGVSFTRGLELDLGG